MKHRCKIKLTATEAVKEFVLSASRCDFDIDIFYNRIVVDAKSILGVLSLDLSQNLTVHYAGVDAEFEKTLEKFCIA